MLQDELNLFIGVANIHTSPNIPRDKLNNAINSYAFGVNADDVLVLVDETLLGSGKEGMLITNKHIYIKETFESPKQYKLENIESIYAKKSFLSSGVYINDKKVFTPTQASFDFIELLCSIIRDNLQDFLEFNSTIYDEEDEYNFLQKLQGDSLYTMTQSGKIVGDATTLFNVALCYFTGLSLQGENTSSEEIRIEIRNFLARYVAKLRKKHIENRNIIELKNDVATLELIVFSAANLALELQMRDFPQEAIENLLFEGLCELLGDNAKELAAYVVGRSVGFTDLEQIVNVTYFTIFLTNRNGSIIKGDINPMEIIYDDMNLMSILLDGEDIESYDDRELNSTISLKIAYIMSEIMGDITEYRAAKYCVDRLIDIAN